MAVQHETELYAPLKTFFEERGYTIKAEITHCDLVGTRPGNPYPLIVEMKKTFNLPLLLQGLERQKLSEEVYLAVERNRSKKGAHNQRWGEITGLCRRLGLGLIAITLFKTKKPFVDVLCSPGEITYGQSQKVSKKKSDRVVREFNERSGDYNVGGSYGAKLMTAYREKALRVALALEVGVEMSPREIRDQSGIGTAAAILQHNYYDWFRRIARGRYVLTPAGVKALSQYADVVVGWQRIATAAEVQGPPKA
ncbi:hypothetical protein EJP82_12370 [Paenibacillus anaericanus]|uniref:Uncharacterized protein n=1 Tax=Paenibacillus anaericanus TaxID=170367 RepID=A0A433Y8Y3_9BACL|nr:DUF2161 family putative PD-(D/E)XK-type phosphodiesterase [Paenibacillus anaericanus]RUT46268.1 hypothetical protein EJP82_12370 [Paenibacillus anaericanus]